MDSKPIETQQYQKELRRDSAISEETQQSQKCSVVSEGLSSLRKDSAKAQ